MSAVLIVFLVLALLALLGGIWVAKWLFILAALFVLFVAVRWAMTASRSRL